MRVIVFLAIALFPTQAFAYFDAGTGSMLIQVAVGLVAGIAVFWGKIKAITSSWFVKNKRDGIHSEDGQ